MNRNREDLLRRITSDPNVCLGKPRIRGHRIRVSFILDLLAGGMSRQEILGDRHGEPLREAGHDVVSVPDRAMSGAQGGRLIEVCRSEGRCLVTLDVEFGSPLLFDPSAQAGIAVLRLSGRGTREA